MLQLTMMEIETVAIMGIPLVGKTMEIGGLKIKAIAVHVVIDQAIGIVVAVITILHRVTNVKNATKLGQKVPGLQMGKKGQKFFTFRKKLKMMICSTRAFQRVLISIDTAKYQLRLLIQPEIMHRNPLNHSHPQG